MTCELPNNTNSPDNNFHGDVSEGEILAGIEEAEHFPEQFPQDHAIAAIANNPSNVISQAYADDVARSLQDRSPVVRAYDSIAARRARRVLPPLVALAFAGAATAGLLNFIGEAKYEFGSSVGMGYAPIAQGNALGFDEKGFPALASKDPNTGKVSYDPTIPTLIIGLGAIAGTGLAAGTLSLSTDPNGMRRTAQRVLKKSQVKNTQE